MTQGSPVAIIPGGTGGLGRALMPLLAERGYRLAVSYLIPEEAEALESELDIEEDHLMLRRVDCTEPEAVGDFMKAAAAEFGQINVMCSLVGGWAGGRDVAETDDVRFDRMIDLNLRSAFYTVRAVIPHLLEADWGRVILVGSRAAIENPSGQAAFNVAKAGVVALATSTAHELENTKVTANVILPSVIDTAASRATLPYADYVDWPKPEAIATVIAFLAMPESQVVSGAAIPVYGNT